KFGLDFRIVNTRMLRELRRSAGLYANPWTHHPRLIVSIDWLKRERPLRMLRELLPPVPEYPRAFDLLVVDEVHTCAPSGTGKYAVDSQRTRAVKLDRKSTRLNSSHVKISYAVFCLKKKNMTKMILTGK